MAKKRKKAWSCYAGLKGRNRVRAYLDKKSGHILLEYQELDEAGGGTKRRTSLRHADREKAADQAAEMAVALRKNEIQTEELSLDKLFDMYLQYASNNSRMTDARRKEVARCVLLFRKSFGLGRKPLDLEKRDFDDFVSGRSTGRLLVGEQKGAVEDATIHCELRVLRAVFNWAMATGNGKRGRLLTRNPLLEFKLPKPTPRRPIASTEDYEALLAVAEKVHPSFAAFLVLAHETGHRTHSLRHLKLRDVDFAANTITWVPEFDKVRFEHTTPVTPEGMCVLKLMRSTDSATTSEWLFPSPRDGKRPLSRGTLIKWWKKAELLAGLRREKGMGLHSLRRKLSNDFRHMPLKDLAYYGGWKNERTLVESYQQPDRETMREAFSTRRR
ncbi:MAG: tyrosine-type recombinase/integrase [Gemmatimonadota bacterium]